MNYLLANPSTIAVHGEYTLLWVFLFGLFFMIWIQSFGWKLVFLREWLNMNVPTHTEDGRIILTMVSPPPEQPQPSVDSKGGADTKEG